MIYLQKVNIFLLVGCESAEARKRRNADGRQLLYAFHSSWEWDRSRWEHGSNQHHFCYMNFLFNWTRFVLCKELFFHLRFTEPREVRVIGICSSKRLKQRHLWKFPETAPSNCTAKPSQNKSHLWKPPETARAIALPRRLALLQTHLWSEGFDFCVFDTCAQTL